MKHLTTRKIGFGILLTLVLVFSVQGIADALSFTSQITRTDKRNVSFVYPGETFEMQFTVSLVGDTSNPVQIGTTRGTRAAYDSTDVTQAGDHGSVAPETASEFYYYDRTSGGTTTRTWVTKDAAYYYNQEQIEITPGADITILSIEGHLVTHASPYTLSEKDSFPGTTVKELTSTTINVKCQVSSTTTTYGARTFSVADTTVEADRPLVGGTRTPVATAPANFTIYVIRNPDIDALPTISDISTTGLILPNQDRTPIKVTLTGGTSTWHQVYFTLASGFSGTFSEKQDGTGNTGSSLTAYTGSTSEATVYLNPNRSTTRIWVTVAGRSPGENNSANSRSVTIFYGARRLTADLTIGGPGGNGQRGRISSRLAKPLVVKVTDQNNRAISGEAITFSITAPAPANGATGPPVAGEATLFPYTGFRAEPTNTSTTMGNSTLGYHPLVVKTDTNGEAKVALKLSNTVASHTVTATLSGTTHTFEATAVDTTETLVLSVDTEKSVQEQSVARLTTASKPLVVRVLAGGVSEISEQAIRFTTTDGSLNPRGEAVQLTSGTGSSVDVDNDQHDRTILTNARGEAWIDYTAGNTDGPVTIWARAYDHTGTNTGSITAFGRLDSANTVIFRVNVGGSTSSPQPPQPPAQEPGDTATLTVTPTTITGPPGSTRDITITASGTAQIGNLVNFAVAGGSASPGSGLGTFTSTLTLPSQAGTYTLDVTSGTQRQRVTVTVSSAAAPDAPTGGRIALEVPLSGAPNSSQSIRVTVLDENGSRVPDVDITLAITSGGGTFSASSVTTGAAGTATSQLTLGSAPGNEYFVTATASNYPSVEQRISITGTQPPTGDPSVPRAVGEAAAVDVYDGDGQRGTPNVRLSDMLVVEVTDANGNPVSGERVTFRTTIGSGRFSPARPRTNGNGRAQVWFTPTSSGTLRIAASVDGVSARAVFRVTTGAPASSLTKVSGDSQSGTPSRALANPFVVEVKDADGDTIEGLPVAFSVAAGGGSLSETSATTDRDGRAETTLTLGSRVGINSVEARVSGVDPVTFNTSIEPEILVAAANRPVMYWIDGGALYRLAGAKVTQIAASANGIAVGGGKVYWTATTGASAGTINAANLDGSGAKVLTRIMAIPMGIAVDTADSKLYWTNARGRIQSANLDGSGIRNVQQNLSNPTDLVVANGFIYWTEDATAIKRVNMKGQKKVQDVATNLDTVGGLAVGGGKVYWTEKTGASAGTVNGANLNGTQFGTLATLLSAPMGVSVDTAGSKLYWTNARGRIQSANLDGSGIRNVVKGLIAPSQLLTAGANTDQPVAKQPTKKDTSAYDVNGDGKVDNVDASLVASGLDTGNAKYDVNKDGAVNFLDLLLIFDNRDADAAGAPTVVGMQLTTVQRDRIEAQIDLLIATNDRSAAAMRTLVYLQQLLVTARPEKTQLLANYPNPFNPETWLPYELATDTDVRITIYNAQGVVIRTLQLGQQSAGYYTDRERAAYWDGRNAFGEQVASGVYFYQLETDTMSALRKMVILK